MRLSAILVIAAACALVWSGVAAAQQPEAPNELWQEYPLNPELGSPEPAEDGPRVPSSRGGGEQVGGGGGDDDSSAAAEEEPFPLVQILVALGLLLLGVLHVLNVLVHRAGVPDRLRERIGAVRDGPPPSRRRPARRSPTLLPTQGAEPRPTASPAIGSGGDRAEPAGEYTGVVEKPAKAPKPKPPPPALKKPFAQKPPPAKPGRPAKPPRPAKPAQAAKAARPAKPQPAPKRPKPARPAGFKPPAPKKPRVEHRSNGEQPPAVVADESRESTLTCSIYWWRDGPVADFYALATGRQGRAWVVDRSPRFEWLAGDFPAEAREAHAALVEALVTAGWRRVGSEGVWYRQRFERPFAAAP